MPEVKRGEYYYFLEAKVIGAEMDKIIDALLFSLASLCFGHAFPPDAENAIRSGRIEFKDHFEIKRKLILKTFLSPQELVGHLRKKTRGFLECLPRIGENPRTHE